MIISAKLRAQIRERDKYRCVYCHTPEELTVTTFEVDHISIGMKISKKLLA